MATKLDWVYDDHARTSQYVADYKGLRLRAVHDEDASNPIEDQDGHWPMLTYSGRHASIMGYDEKVHGVMVDAPLDRFTDEHLIHDQKAIAEALGCDPYAEFECRWIRHADALRQFFEDAIGDIYDSKKLDTYAELYELLGIPYLSTTSRGYCQGDQGELLIVATPEAQKQLRSQPADMDDETWAKTLQEDMQNQAKLYDAWAWGDVYGYVIERQRDYLFADEEDETDSEWVEVDACWGFYGSDFDWSGLEDAAIEAAEHHLPKELKEAA